MATKEEKLKRLRDTAVINGLTGTICTSLGGITFVSTIKRAKDSVFETCFGALFTLGLTAYGISNIISAYDAYVEADKTEQDSSED